MKGLEKFEKVEPFIAISGYVFSFFDLFEKSDTEIILDAIEKISKQISALQTDMNYYFNKVLQALHQESCYSKLATYEQKIMSATNKL